MLVVGLWTGLVGAGCDLLGAKGRAKSAAPGLEAVFHQTPYFHMRLSEDGRYAVYDDQTDNQLVIAERQGTKLVERARCERAGLIYRQWFNGRLYGIARTQEQRIFHQIWPGADPDSCGARSGDTAIHAAPDTQYRLTFGRVAVDAPFLVLQEWLEGRTYSYVWAKAASAKAGGIADAPTAVFVPPQGVDSLVIGRTQTGDQPRPLMAFASGWYKGARGRQPAGLCVPEGQSAANSVQMGPDGAKKSIDATAVDFATRIQLSVAQRARFSFRGAQGSELFFVHDDEQADSRLVLSGYDVDQAQLSSVVASSEADIDSNAFDATLSQEGAVLPRLSFPFDPMWQWHASGRSPVFFQEDLKGDDGLFDSISEREGWFLRTKFFAERIGAASKVRERNVGLYARISLNAPLSYDLCVGTACTQYASGAAGYGTLSAFSTRFDGQTVPGYLLCPTQRVAAPSTETNRAASHQRNAADDAASTACTASGRLVVVLHDGPSRHRFYPGYDSRWRVLAERLDAAVLFLNYPGTEGYGAAYQALGQQQWHNAVAASISAAAQQVVADGQAAADKIALYGYSFGGHLALATVRWERASADSLQRSGDHPRPPTPIPCAIAHASVTDQRLRYASYLDDSQGAYKAYIETVFGDQDHLVQASPRTSPEAFADTARVLLMHGQADPRVPPVHAQRLLDAVEAHVDAQTRATATPAPESGYNLTSVIFQGEGHWLSQRANQVAELALTEKFLLECWGDNDAAAKVDVAAQVQLVVGQGDAHSACIHAVLGQSTVLGPQTEASASPPKRAEQGAVAAPAGAALPQCDPGVVADDAPGQTSLPPPPAWRVSAQPGAVSG